LKIKTLIHYFEFLEGVSHLFLTFAFYF
jgi:hypothetical protein